MTTNLFEAMRMYCHLRSRWRNTRIAAYLCIMRRSGWFPVKEKFCYEPEIPLSMPKWVSKLLPEKYEYGAVIQHLETAKLLSDRFEPLSEPLKRARIPCIDLSHSEKMPNPPSSVPGAGPPKWTMYNNGPWTSTEDENKDAGAKLAVLGRVHGNVGTLDPTWSPMQTGASTARMFSRDPLRPLRTGASMARMLSRDALRTGASTTRMVGRMISFGQIESFVRTHVVSPPTQSAACSESISHQHTVNFV